MIFFVRLEFSINIQISNLEKFALKSAPDEVICANSNVALNARQSHMQLSPAEKRLFRPHAHGFDLHADRHRRVA